ncbi:MAG: hypothetical protein GY711_13870 [bacterium]|nr:hypothetical protein [bacterium]
MYRTLALLLTLPACTTTGETFVAKPQRPTFSSDTSTTGEGSVEFEAGVALDPGDAFALPATAKYGLSDKSELFIGLPLYALIDESGGDPEGVGDLFIGTRHRVWEEDPTSVAFQLATKLPTGDSSLSTDEVDFFAAGILTHGMNAKTSVTAYYELGYLGDPDGDADVQNALAGAAAYALDDETTLFGELAEIFGPEDVDPIFTTLGVAHALEPNVIVDVAVAVGLNDDAADAVLLFGVTTNAGRLQSMRL